MLKRKAPAHHGRRIVKLRGDDIFNPVTTAPPCQLKFDDLFPVPSSKTRAGVPVKDTVVLLRERYPNHRFKKQKVSRMEAGDGASPPRFKKLSPRKSKSSGDDGKEDQSEREKVVLPQRQKTTLMEYSLGNGDASPIQVTKISPLEDRGPTSELEIPLPQGQKGTTENDGAYPSQEMDRVPVTKPLQEFLPPPLAKGKAPTAKMLVTPPAKFSKEAMQDVGEMLASSEGTQSPSHRQVKDESKIRTAKTQVTPPGKVPKEPAPPDIYEIPISQEEIQNSPPHHPASKKTKPLTAKSQTVPPRISTPQDIYEIPMSEEIQITPSKRRSIPRKPMEGIYSHPKFSPCRNKLKTPTAKQSTHAITAKRKPNPSTTEQPTPPANVHPPFKPPTHKKPPPKPLSNYNPGDGFSPHELSLPLSTPYKQIRNRGVLTPFKPPRQRYQFKELELIYPSREMKVDKEREEYERFKGLVGQLIGVKVPRRGKSEVIHSGSEGEGEEEESDMDEEDSDEDDDSDEADSDSDESE
ncbi:hypothetical protein K470DRAFT_292458 [Piedraia hortae CBS 480.64]|uniref:Uncharacterized protein n=1 Tax=Piedraia hortae CBS 480.64 TaxID=1314780 RepID=A0A6A7C9M2_9PEZI|nr:hypothetical protein K470DRAFT_292458 [Piedraia hortae CBS 480.64]